MKLFSIIAAMALMGNIEAIKLSPESTTNLQVESKSRAQSMIEANNKLFAELNQKIYELAIELQGAEGMLHTPGYPMTRSDHARAYEELSSLFLRSRANTIEGGTSEIMRNILGERVLGLPGEPRADKGVPWKDVPR